ncbi:MAG: NAD(+)/NADH kinase [Chloroflexota bacterium]|nr:NAD(+)/NADH kinase [Chloroflexota bacterium]
MTPFKRIGVLAHPTRPQSFPLAERIAAGLTARGLDVWQFARWTESDVNTQIADTDGVIAIGGDGAMLRAARVCATFGVPVLGINMGHLGFLTEIRDPDAWETQIDAVLNGDFWIEQRMMLQIETEIDGVPIVVHALNDAVISRGVHTHVTQFDMYIDGGWTTRYHADGLIVATATGSTAYALACGGPILPPETRNILVVPVAPHLSLDRPIVLPEGARVEVVIAPDKDEPAVLTADGAFLGDLPPDTRVLVQASPNISRFVRLRERNYFYRSLLDRLEPRISAPAEPNQISRPN